ncbi:hypothetical protein [Thiocapsa rosea]|uniref:hypothetical protein n=1 Tax=Thiocapsa rosea TaxID=69360 RepID=UPI001B886CAD|nr:hypothetical protein [Thiocapsa rosea]
MAYFKAAHALNPELETRYAVNRLGLTRCCRSLYFTAQFQNCFATNAHTFPALMTPVA